MPAGYREQSYTDRNPNSVEAAWTYLASEDGQHRVLPDGRCDVILRFEFADGRPISRIEPLIAGPSTSYHIVPIKRGLGFVGVRLRPGTAGQVFGVALSALADRVFYAREAIRIIPALSKLAAPAQSIDTLVSRLTGFVADRVTNGNSSSTSARCLALIGALHTGGGRLSVRDLAGMYGIDERTVRRDIKEGTGLTPKELSMVLQFHRALRLLRDVGLDPASAASEAGYADQAHMTRMFRKFGGFTPAKVPDVTLANLPL